MIYNKAYLKQAIDVILSYILFYISVPSSPGQNHYVVFNTSSFIVSWVEPVGYIDKYVVEVFCHVSTGYAHSVSLSSVQVSGVTPGDCCRLNVTAQGHQYYSTPQLYYVYLNETGILMLFN